MGITKIKVIVLYEYCMSCVIHIVPIESVDGYGKRHKQYLLQEVNVNST
jgi:hypothetical protein